MTLQNDLHIQEEDIKDILATFMAIPIEQMILLWLDKTGKTSEDKRKRCFDYITEFIRDHIVVLENYNDGKATCGEFMQINHIYTIHNIFNHKGWDGQAATKRARYYLDFMGFIGFALQGYIENELRSKQGYIEDTLKNKQK